MTQTTISVEEFGKKINYMAKLFPPRDPVQLKAIGELLYDKMKFDDVKIINNVLEA